jgi:hypothetical protein
MECLVELQDKSFYTGYSNDSSTVGSSTVGSRTTITGDTSTCFDDDTYNNAGDGDGDGEQRDARTEARRTRMERSRSMTSIMARERVL